MKLLFSFLVIILSFNCSYAEVGVQREDPAYTASGNMLIFRAVPRDKTIKLYLLGRESAEMNFQKDAKLVSVTLLEKGQKRNLEFRPVGSHYEIIGAPSKGKYDLELKAEVQDRPENATLSISKP